MELRSLTKKGEATFGGWTAAVLLVLLAVVIVSTQILAPMNTTYNKSFSVGLDTSAIDDFEAARQSSDSILSTSEVEQTAEGLSLKEAWGVGKIVYQAIVGFLTGGFLDNLLVNILGLPAIVGTIARILFLMSLIFIIIYLFMKVKP